MRSHEITASEANRLGSRPQPKRHGVALIRRPSVSLPHDLGIAVAKVNSFDFVVRSFKERIHVVGPGLKPSRNHEAMLTTKRNPACLDGELYNCSGPAFTPGAVHGHDEFTKRQGLLPASGFHSLKCKLASRAGAMGCSPHG